MPIESRRNCEYCKKSSVVDPEKLERIGHDVTDEINTGRGMSGTDFEFYQCMSCGHVHVKYRDTGVGSGGPFWKCLTAGLF